MKPDAITLRYFCDTEVFRYVIYVDVCLNPNIREQPRALKCHHFVWSIDTEHLPFFPEPFFNHPKLKITVHLSHPQGYC